MIYFYNVSVSLRPLQSRVCLLHSQEQHSIQSSSRQRVGVEMGGAVSRAPARDVALVAHNPSKVNAIFNKIARRGHEMEDIKHPKLGKKDDELCLTEIVLYLNKANDPFFHNFTIKPIVIIKESYFYCFKRNEARLKNKKKQKRADRDFLKMNRAIFPTFLLALFWYSRLWNFFVDDNFNSHDDKEFLEKIKRSGICQENIDDASLQRAVLSIANWKEECGKDKSQDLKDVFILLAEICIEHGISPEDYFSFVPRIESESAVISPKVRQTNAAPSKMSLINEEMEVLFSEGMKKCDESPSADFGFSRSLHLNIDTDLHDCEDMDISNFSPINSNASIVIRSNSIPLEPMNDTIEESSSIGNTTCFTKLSVNDDLRLSVQPLKPEYSNSLDMAPALCSLYGGSLGNRKHLPLDSNERKRQQDEAYNEWKALTSSELPSNSSSCQGGGGVADCLNTKQVKERVVPVQHRGWHDLNKKRDIIHRPESLSPHRIVYVGTDDGSPTRAPVLIKPLQNIGLQNATMPPTTSSGNQGTSLKNTKTKSDKNKDISVKRNWRRNKDEKAPLWKPRHAISSKKKKFSTVRTMQI